MPRREHKTTPLVLSGTLYHAGDSIAVESVEWYAWLADGSTFYYETPAGSFTGRCERRGAGRYWYAYRRHRGKLYKTYLGQAAAFTIARLDEVAQQLADQAGAPG
jgi:LuxR family maltose regulon positive regulatory protein